MSHHPSPIHNGLSQLIIIGPTSEISSGNHPFAAMARPSVFSNIQVFA
jgi:hypothetical protein